MNAATVGINKQKTAMTPEIYVRDADGTTRTLRQPMPAMVRRAMQELGVATAREVAAFCRTSSGVVCTDLRREIDAGNVLYRAARYYWVGTLEPEVVQAISQAKALLRANGYSVERGFTARKPAVEVQRLPPPAPKLTTINGKKYLPEDEYRRLCDTHFDNAWLAGYEQGGRS